MDGAITSSHLVSPKSLALLLVLLLIWVVFTSIVPVEYKPSSLEEKAVVSFKALANGETVLNKSIYVERGTNAFEAMQTVATVGYQDYGNMGVFVEAINGVKPNEGEFWKLYVNGEEAQLGISGIAIEEDTTVEWKTESVESYTG